MKVYLDSGEIVKAIVYVMADDRKGICPPFSGVFPATCQPHLPYH